MADNRNATSPQVGENDLAASLGVVSLNHERGHPDEEKELSSKNTERTSTHTNGTHPDQPIPEDEPADHPDDDDYGEVVDLPPPEQLKKKKRRKKPKSQRGLVRKHGLRSLGDPQTDPSSQDKPTGFEDFFADAPMTPAQHAEEQELYDP